MIAPSHTNSGPRSDDVSPTMVLFCLPRAGYRRTPRSPRSPREEAPNGKKLSLCSGSNNWPEVQVQYRSKECRSRYMPTYKFIE